MATVNLGKIKLKWRGTYASGTAYTPDDVVAYTDGSVTSSYICVTASTGNAPSSGGSAHSSWNFLAKGQNASPTTNQGDIIVRGASADGGSYSSRSFAGRCKRCFVIRRNSIISWY